MYTIKINCLLYINIIGSIPRVLSRNVTFIKSAIPNYYEECTVTFCTVNTKIICLNCANMYFIYSS